MFELSDSHGIDRNTATAAIQLLDIYSMRIVFPQEFHRFMSGECKFDYDDRVGSLSSDLYVLMGLTCFYVACKFCEGGEVVFGVDLAVNVVEGRFCREQIEEMELCILKTVLFQLNGATPNRVSLLCVILRALVCCVRLVFDIMSNPALYLHNTPSSSLRCSHSYSISPRAGV